jgi:hypothetical protein
MNKHNEYRSFIQQQRQSRIAHCQQGFQLFNKHEADIETLKQKQVSWHADKVTIHSLRLQRQQQQQQQQKLKCQQ